MPVYKYKALNSEKKTISGLVEAENEDGAIDLLRDNELSIISLSENTYSVKKNAFVFGGIKPKDVVIFSRQFSVLVSANVTLVQSLKLLVEQTKNAKFQAIVSEIANEVDGGARLSDSMAKYPKVFSPFYVNIIKSGETSGKLDEVLNYLADEVEKDYDMTSKIKGAMIYPAFVMTGLGVVGAVMMIFVVPKLTAIMQESGGELPVATRILIAVSGFMASYWWFLLIFIIGSIVGIKFFSRTPAGKKFFGTLIIHLPIFGNLFQRIYLVRFTRSLQTLLIGGVSITKALSIVAEVVNNHVYKSLILETKKEIEDGNSIATVFLKSKEIPSMVTQMMSIGEKTGRLDTILERITDFYTREINNIVANLMTLMEPIIMVVMGVGVGLMVAAVIMPMYNMAQQV